MNAPIVIEVVKSNARPKFRLAAPDGAEFVLDSFLVVDGRGVPLWEFVRNEFERQDDAQIAAVVVDIDVLSDAFREALKADPWHEPRRKGEAVHEVRYGSVPAGYKQTIPEEGVPTLELDAPYRAVVFSSVGSASAVFAL